MGYWLFGFRIFRVTRYRILKIGVAVDWIRFNREPWHLGASAFKNRGKNRRKQQRMSQDIELLPRVTARILSVDRIPFEAYTSMTTS